jgi:hypothetical protein
VFYPDLFGASYEDTGGDGEKHHVDMPVIEKLDQLILARQRFAHGVQTLWFDHPNCIAFSRSGTQDNPGCVVVMSNGDDGEKTLNLGVNYGNKVWRDYLGTTRRVSPPMKTVKARFIAMAGVSASGYWKRCCDECAERTDSLSAVVQGFTPITVFFASACVHSTVGLSTRRKVMPS